MRRSKVRLGNLFLLGSLLGTTLAFVRPIGRNYCPNLPLSDGGHQSAVENEIRVLDEVDVEDKSSPAWGAVQSEINGYSMPLGQKTVGYSAFLDRKKRSWVPLGKKITAKYDTEMNEDGYANLQRSSTDKILRSAMGPLRLLRELWKGSTVEPGTLVLVRHGESEWNSNKTFTGWADPDLTEQGKREVEHAARLLMEGGFKIDVVFTSRLKRAIRSVWILLQEFNQVYLPVFKSWRLNERMVSLKIRFVAELIQRRLGDSP
jgi:Histidine phosphatase superfamily (branch 1)